MYANGSYRYNQHQIQARAEYYGLYMFACCHKGLTGRALKVWIAQQMKGHN